VVSSSKHLVSCDNFTDIFPGRGHYARNKATHKRQMESEGRAMHHEATRAIKAAVDKLLDDLPSKFTTAYSSVLEQIREEIKLFFEQNSSNGQRKLRNGTRRLPSKAKERLQKALSIDINTLANDWTLRWILILRASLRLTILMTMTITIDMSTNDK
jgi:gas vesicle protein